MEQAEITIIGAGIIGLAVAAELSKVFPNIFVIEKNSSFGEEISSRNSEVIHAGIYYPKDSLKAKTCIEGRQLLYEYCVRNNVGYKKTGKLIVAINTGEVRELETLFKNGLKNGVTDLRLLSKDEVKDLEPCVECVAAIYSPSTGIIDSHALMKSLVYQLEAQGGMIAYNTELKDISRNREGFEITIEDKKEGRFKFLSRIAINCAGLNADEVAAMAGLFKEEYKLKYCKGDYFRVSPRKAGYIKHLVYPVPKHSRAGLGIHATLDLAGGLRLGPDDEYVDRIDYNVDASKQEVFYESARHFLPFLKFDDLSPDIAGIRPKLQGPGEDFRDFIIREETESGLSGFVNLIGIESPGLTACFSIARIVKRLVKL